jgi:PII-like signaling protein
MKTRPARKITIYVDETDKLHGKPVYETVMEICYSNRVSGVSVFRGVAGYGGQRVFHTAKILELSTSLPVKIEIVDSEESINKVLPEIAALISKGLLEISDTTVIETGI